MAKDKKLLLLNSQEISAFCGQIAMFERGGVPLYEGTAELADEMEDVRLKEVLNKLHEGISENLPIYKAVEETKAFPEYMVYMTKIGEETGNLEAVMDSLEGFYAREASLKAGIKSAVTFPMILFGIMTAVMMVLVFKISPMFKEMFDEIAGGNAADSSERLMNTGMIAGKVCVFILLALFLLMIVILLLTKTRIGGKFIGRLTTGISPLKKISRVIQKGRLMSSLSLMLRSGTPMDEALENVEMGVSAEYAGKIKKARKFISEENANFSDALKKADITSGMENVMLSVGEKSGTLDVVVEKIAKQYDEEISEALDGVTTRLETLLVIVLSVMVAAVIISVMLPLTSVISSIS